MSLNTNPTQPVHSTFTSNTLLSDLSTTPLHNALRLSINAIRCTQPCLQQHYTHPTTYGLIWYLPLLFFFKFQSEEMQVWYMNENLVRQDVQPQAIPQVVLFGRQDVRGVGVRGSVIYRLTNPSRRLPPGLVCMVYPAPHEPLPQHPTCTPK